MAQDVRILNMMMRGFTLNLPAKDKIGKPTVETVNIASRTAVTVDKAKFDAAMKSTKSLKALVDQKRLVVANASGAITTPAEGDLHKRSSSPELPENLKDTKDAEAMDGKVKHEVKKVEHVEVEAPAKPEGDAPAKASDGAPEGGKRDS